MKQLRFFDNFPVIAGFSLKPEKAQDVRASLCGKKRSVVWPLLVHGTDIAVISEEAEDGIIRIEDTDGAITDRTDVALTTSHGDCLAIYAFDPQKKVIGLAHAGWRGTLGGIAAKLVEGMSSEYGCDAGDILAYISPGIGACCFEVSQDVALAFDDSYYWAEQYIYKKPDSEKYYIDLKGYNDELLQNAGVGRVDIDAHCTCCEPDMFYSHRRCADKDRMLAYIMLA